MTVAAQRASTCRGHPAGPRPRPGREPAHPPPDALALRLAMGKWSISPSQPGDVRARGQRRAKGQRVWGRSRCPSARAAFLVAPPLCPRKLSGRATGSVPNWWGRGAGRTSRPVSRILCPPRAAGDGHPSGHTVTGYLERSTRGLGRAALPVRHRTSIRAVAPRAMRPSTLLRAGFTEPPRSPGVLVRSYRTVSPLPRRRGRGGLFSVALSRGSPRVAVSNRPALWSPDFPRAGAWPPVGAGSPVRGRPADSFAAPV